MPTGTVMNTTKGHGFIAPKGTATGVAILRRTAVATEYCWYATTEQAPTYNDIRKGPGGA